MKIKLSGAAEQDIEVGCDFYQKIDTKLAAYFNDCIATDIDSLLLFAGIRATVDGWHYTFSKRFPFVIWYGLRKDLVIVFAILDARREPSENDAILRGRRREPD